jgi:hypothetical protein
MTRPDKDVANACIAQWHATTNIDATKSRYYFRTFEGRRPLSNNSGRLKERTQLHQRMNFRITVSSLRCTSYTLS